MGEGYRSLQISMNRQRYIFLASTDATERFPNNAGNDFTVNLSPEIKIPRDEDWSVAITELEISPSISTTFVICSRRGGSRIFSQGGSGGTKCQRDAAGVRGDGKKGGLGDFPPENLESEVL